MEGSLYKALLPRANAVGSPLRAQPPYSAKVHELEAKTDGNGWSKELHTAQYESWTSREKLTGLLVIQPRTREGLLMAVQPLASQVGVAQ